MNKKKRQQIFARLKESNPNPTTELEYNTTFELLIAVILSAQATDVGVNKATKVLFKIANTPKQIIELGVDGLKNYIKTIGLYNSKAVNIFNTCKILLDKYNSEVPEDRNALESLPGVGRKTANVVLNTAFGWETIAVDTHIFRLSNRINLAPGKNVDEVEKKLNKLVPKEYKYNSHHWLILHGRYICVARKPKCKECILVDLCEYKDKNI